MTVRSTRHVALAAAAAAPIFVAVPALAHPHVYIDVRVQVMFDAEGRIAGLEQVWLFDEFFTTFVIDGMDGDGDGLPDAPELDAWLVDVMENLRDFDYYTEANAGGAPVAVADATDMSVRMNGAHLSIAFTTPFAAAASPGGQPFTYAIYDPTYYIDMLHAEGGEPIRLAGAAEGCGFDVIEPNPDPATVELAAGLDQTQSAGNTLGAFFAERVVVQCGPSS